jgi:hypothetical protein
MIFTFRSLSQRSKTLTRSLILCGLLAAMGCQPNAKKEEPVAATSDQLATLKVSIEKADPGSMVGEVIYTLADRPYTAVGGVDMANVKLGQIVSFVDGAGSPINNGTVVAIAGDNAHIRFDNAGKRPPQKGDLAVWLKS